LLSQQVFAKTIGAEVVREVGKDRASVDLWQAKACRRSSSDIDLGTKMSAKRKVYMGRELNALCPLFLVVDELVKSTILLYKNTKFNVNIGSRNSRCHFGKCRFSTSEASAISAFVKTPSLV
jgi:hypothetical protein